MVLGMYCIEGFPESIYNTAIEISKSWKDEGFGEIRATNSMKYHGKVYGFYKNEVPIAVLVGSHNLSSLHLDANNLRQYDLSMYSEEGEDCEAVSLHLTTVIKSPVSLPIDEIENFTIIHEENTKLNGVEGVTKVSQADVEVTKLAQTNITFNIPLKVPGMPGVSEDFMKSNINKCYAKGRLNSRTNVVTEHGWWETEVIVPSSITSQKNYWFMEEHPYP